MIRARSSAWASFHVTRSGGESQLPPLCTRTASWRSMMRLFSRFPLKLWGAEVMTSPRCNPASSRLPASELVPLRCIPTIQTTRPIGFQYHVFMVRALAEAPLLSLLVIVHRMPEQAGRTLRSLSPSYQRNAAASDYEVIVVENASDRLLGAEVAE